MNKKAAIFDFDGLLVDSEKACWHIYETMAQMANMTIDDDTYARDFSGKSAKVNVGQLVKRYKIGLSFEEAMDLMKKLEEEELKNIPAKKGAKELIEWLKNNNYRIGLATSSIPERAKRILKTIGLENAFDTMVFGNDVKKGKPEPDIFLKAAEKLGVGPDLCVVFEDSGNGIMAAIRAGMDVMYVPDWILAPAQIASQATYTLSSLDEAIEKLAE